MAEEKPIAQTEVIEKDTTKRFQYSTTFRKHKIMKAKMARKSRKINRRK
jgi:hypothetical protein